MKNTYSTFQVFFLSVLLFYTPRTLQEKVDRYAEEDMEPVKAEREEGFFVFRDLLSAASQEDILVRLDTTSVAEDRLWNAARALHTAITKLPEMEESYTSQSTAGTKQNGLKTKDDHETSPHGFDNSDRFDDDEDELTSSATRTVSQYYEEFYGSTHSPPYTATVEGGSVPSEAYISSTYAPPEEYNSNYVTRPPPTVSPSPSRSSVEPPPKSRAVTTQPVPKSDDDDFDGGVLTGITIAALLLLVVLFILVILLLCRCLMNRSQNRAPHIVVPAPPYPNKVTSLQLHTIE